MATLKKNYAVILNRDPIRFLPPEPFFTCAEEHIM